MVSELKTDRNRLSVWKVENDEDLLDAFVALGANSEHIGTISAVKIKPQDLNAVCFESEEGVSPTRGINEKHRNIKDLNYLLLGDVAMSVIKGLGTGGYIRKTKGDMKKLLIDAYKKNKLDMENMSPTLKEEIMDAVSFHECAGIERR